MATNENLPPNVVKQLAKELKNLDEFPPEGIKVSVNEDDFSTIFANVDGPAGTPYENGVFRMKLLLSHDFPYSPPKGYFLTKIFHPNIATNGEICVNALKKDWNPSLGLRHVIIVIRCLLIEPFPESALNEQAGKMLIENYDEYERYARLYTGIHAMKPRAKTVMGGAMSDSNSAMNIHQEMTVEQEIAAVPLPPSSAATIFPMKGVTTMDGASATTNTKKEAMRGVGERKKLDARKKGMRRL